MSSSAFVSLSPVDFVAVDTAALASHMRHCEIAKGQWFTTFRALQRARAFTAGRLVTLAVAGVVVATLIAIAL